MRLRQIVQQPAPEEVSETEIEQLLDLIRIIYGFDFTNYSKASMRRRLINFMVMRNIPSITELRKKIVNQESVFDELLDNLTVTVTEMFRDPELYLSIREKVLPTLNTWPLIRVWNAGCATGEEVYSMAILLKEEGLLKKSRIYATDINGKALADAIRGKTNLSLMKDYTRNYIKAGGKETFSDYYTVQGDRVYWSRTLSGGITFSQHNLVSDKSFNEFNLILCRNVMIYFNRELHDQVIKLFLDSLAMFGYLVLGSKESLLLSKYQKHFEVIDKHNKIYRRIR